MTVDRSGLKACTKIFETWWSREVEIRQAYVSGRDAIIRTNSSPASGDNRSRDEQDEARTGKVQSIGNAGGCRWTRVHPPV